MDDGEEISFWDFVTQMKLKNFMSKFSMEAFLEIIYELVFQRK